ncbi:hypothetical protein HY489_00745 [Candidatus Woesearchaeota archaeon]|nr:hypothetical protein [Candidatus Woesearchaeota archaeon]
MSDDIGEVVSEEEKKLLEVEVELNSRAQSLGVTYLRAMAVGYSDAGSGRFAPSGDESLLRFFDYCTGWAYRNRETVMGEFADSNNSVCYDDFGRGVYDAFRGERPDAVSTSYTAGYAVVKRFGLHGAGETALFGIGRTVKKKKRRHGSQKKKGFL